MNEIIEELYIQFSKYEFKSISSNEKSRLSEPIVNELKSLPLREISAKCLASYIPKAISTFGTIDHFRYLLPRILETVSDRNEFDEMNLDLQVVFSKLDYARWQNWDLHEREVLEKFLTNYWQNKIKRFDGFEDEIEPVSDVINAIALTRIDLKEFINSWIEDESIESGLHAFCFVESSMDKLDGFFYNFGPYWNDISEQNIVMNHSIYRLIKKAENSFKFVPEDENWRISKVQNLVEKYKENRLKKN